jgi:tetratricopeptide (TPR) repeat protein
MIRSIALLAIVCVMAGLISAQQPVKCLGPLSEERLRDLIKSQVAEKRLHAYVQTCGVGFELSDTVKSRLRSAGASAELLDDIRVHGPERRLADDAATNKRQAEQARWESVKDSRNTRALEQFLRDYPDSEHASAARLTHDSLKGSETPAKGGQENQEEGEQGWQKELDSAVKLLNANRCKEALDKLERVARTNPANVDIQNALGLTYVCLSLPSTAIQHFSRAIDIQPGYAAAYGNRGQVFLQSRQFELAIQDFDWALQQEPGNGSLYWQRGQAKLGLRRYEDALKDFERAIALDPVNPDGYQGRGRVFYELGKYAEALADFEAAIARKHDFTDAIEYRARTLERLKQAR